MERKKTRTLQIGSVKIGGGEEIAVQSMLCAPAADVEANVEQAKRLFAAGCDIIRVAVPDRESVRLIGAIKAAVPTPLVADIHFDYRLALAAVEAGVDKVRINPGNIGGRERVQAVADACKAHGVPIRIGVNGGSLEKEILQKYGAPTAPALVESALYHISLLEECGFTDIAISLKSSSVPTMIEAYRLMSQRCDYPLHLGVTEAGTERMGLIKSAIGIGSLLCDGIGDTIRVSLTDDPVKEVRVARDILKALGIGKQGVRVVSCPTCGRTQIDLIALAKEVDRLVEGMEKDITVAVMGCAVNGPGEAREADIGVAGGDGCGLLFRKGEILRKVPEDQILPALMEEIERL
ncbi:flavodoxin-dependent (E)-4-hydroxy-3-methylbut-2-enyl-diphosphate synthase [Bittarella massiliensis]|uniref:flavodoxin-dependent (E)-4-hydroxy-3-methylbut-2-enyl-diphosphate synthase n=1 Tax=Bittarella massiliensis (ex Durand et al. 2017) TaxID=1720313 RepID=UPI00163CC32B|nr:flavodoxin-dependent (E)-4-hydroxy-3-methylbut-2-enyl-diphosphate synthase [Bittarella massiliensis (ex Durand et al. 2017)]MBC2870515.1 flavodoxin-dependent (E)-4-hydroxy-3-methylbut-2-enyl-diphosphate synthase [Bittarella massiliensis (ex Durand et al. 2017)]